MARDSLHSEPFDEATIVKLQLFQLYTREWLPVFTAPAKPWKKEINIFDFFAGSGQDSEGVPGSPLRILGELTSPSRLEEIRDKGLQVRVSFSDRSEKKIQRLRELIANKGIDPSLIQVRCSTGEFDERFQISLPALRRLEAANLVIIDQYGVKQVSDSVFQTLIQLEQTDFLFFISSSYLHRFQDHPAIKRYIEFQRPEDYNQVHNVVLEHYRDLIPKGQDYWLAPFSLKKGSNVYGIIFGSGHPLGMEKFLRVAWKHDAVNGEANFDISREGFVSDQPELGFIQPRKLDVFSADLRADILEGRLGSESDIYRFCLSRGMTPSHARPVISELKKEKRVEAAFDVPQIESLSESRGFRLL